MQSAARRTSVAIAATAAVAALTGSAALAAPTAARTITGGHTTITLNSKLTNALDAHNLTLSPTGTATLKGGNLRLPVTGGTSNQPYYVVEHGGGFAFSNGSDRVKISHITINTKAGDGKADVTGNGRIVALKVGSPNMGGGTPNTIQYGGYSVKLSGALVKILDNKLGTSVFANHPLLGVGSTNLQLAH